MAVFYKKSYGFVAVHIEVVTRSEGVDCRVIFWPAGAGFCRFLAVVSRG